MVQETLSIWRETCPTVTFSTTNLTYNAVNLHLQVQAYPTEVSLVNGFPVECLLVVVVVVVCRVLAANAPGYTTACRLIVKPLVLDVPTSTAVKGGTIGREMASNLAESSDFHATLGIFYMPQICDMGQTALLPL